ncbi:hypothetical protein [Actinomadura macrotermitis]|uniref:Uncharacterized protein n=1 Tax=Actinomadura macrotermitis TaxID=2585200 RepID=A0A7K0C8F0_9ACTN|nr:hypothetical protein [Actinomadura macrotermitis]MQY09730.1 hypothetical protein [Actinomadura macrotermitis]
MDVDDWPGRDLSDEELDVAYNVLDLADPATDVSRALLDLIRSL